MPLRIYLVEDNPIIRENLAATLAELAGTELAGSAEGESEAKRWFADNSEHWDLAVVDLFLKQGNGLGVVAACQQRLPRQKLIVLTNYASPGVREQCIKLGADAVFDKSNEIEDLVSFCIDQSDSMAA